MTNETTCPACGHTWCTENIFSASDIKKMQPEDYEKNRDEILRQLSEGKILR
jgi:predicted NBD/HSP70 family sugar kinase